MGVTIGWFFRDPAPRDDEDRVVVRAGRRKVLDMGGLGLTDELLVPNLDGKLELLAVHHPARRRQRRQLHP